MTNLLASIFILFSTNHTEVVTRWGGLRPTACPDAWKDTGYSCAVYHCEPFDPQEKQQVTTVKRLKIAVFSFEGVKHSVTNETVVSETRITLEKQSGWKEK